jgi:hypothetical protein
MTFTRIEQQQNNIENMKRRHTMFCSQCGANLPEEIKFCTQCGAKVISNTSEVNKPVEKVPEQPPNAIESEAPRDKKSNLEVGYSRKIDDPAFKQYLKNSNRWAGIFSAGLAIIAIIGFYIAGEVSSEMDNPESLYIGFGIGGMFLLIGFFQIIGRKNIKTWDGVVVNKTVEEKKRKRTVNDETRWEKCTVYTVHIHDQQGKQHEIRTENDDTVYRYWNVGDHLRYHSGLKSYEKYDKSGDTIVFCAACASLNDLDNDICFRCKCPLLK